MARADRVRPEEIQVLAETPPATSPATSPEGHGPPEPQTVEELIVALARARVAGQVLEDERLQAFSRLQVLAALLEGTLPDLRAVHSEMQGVIHRLQVAPERVRRSQDKGRVQS